MSADLELVGPIAVQHLDQIVRDRAHAFITRCDGLADAGMTELAHEGRFVAARLLDTLDALEAERSARQAIQARADTLQELVGKAAYTTCKEAAP